MQKDGVIVYLTQNNDVRRTYLKTSLYFLFRNFNSKFRYPVIICHEGDYDARSQEEVLAGIRGECEGLVTFRRMKSTDFTLPPFVDKERLAKVLEAAPVPYWRNDKYRMMCRWWMRNVYEYTKGYKYVMRLDDDSIIEEVVDKDLFSLADSKGAIYLSNLIHTDCGLCCYGMRQLFDTNFPKKAKEMEKMWVPSEIPKQHPLMEKIGGIVKANGHELYLTSSGNIRLDMPVMFYNNFHITSVDFWKRPDVQAFLDKIDEHGGIFYYRWGDAPLQSMIAAYMAGSEKIMRVAFKYSKRMQREAFTGDDGKFYKYMPNVYSQSSCMTER